MAARASSTSAAAERPSGSARTAGRGRRAAIGIAWGQACLFAASTLVPAQGIRAGAELGSPALRVLEWTLLLPLSLSVAAVYRTANTTEALAAHGLPQTALPLPALAGWTLVAFFAALLASRGQMVARAALAIAVVAGCVAAGVHVPATAEARDAEQIFLRMVKTDLNPWDDPVSRSAARALATRYPDSRWASEAWRVIAIDAERRDSVSEALAAWQSFGECFDNTSAPGRSLAALNSARLLERSAPADVAAAHYARALRSIGTGEDAVQAWIAPEAAGSLARLSQRSGLYATAAYWQRRTQPDPGK
ncbi:MAG: hypothetical protein RQ731_08260 [Anaerosomatales bacterium]|nr:hypothetical protein [Anaerosomatales bacterium]